VGNFNNCINGGRGGSSLFLSFLEERMRTGLRGGGVVVSARGLSMDPWRASHLCQTFGVDTLGPGF
jgi:hypothetical protein